VVSYRPRLQVQFNFRARDWSLRALLQDAVEGLAVTIATLCRQYGARCLLSLERRPDKEVLGEGGLHTLDTETPLFDVLVSRSR
jgi:hypothetical protein